MDHSQVRERGLLAALFLVALATVTEVSPALAPRTCSANFSARPSLKASTLLTRNWTSYNPQGIRVDQFILGLHGSSKGNKIAPLRSTSASKVSRTFGASGTA